MEAGEGSELFPAKRAAQSVRGTEFRSTSLQRVWSCGVAEEEPPPCRENRQQGDTCENVLETERHFCVMPLSLCELCWFCSVPKVFVFISARIPEYGGFWFQGAIIIF